MFPSIRVSVTNNVNNYGLVVTAVTVDTAQNSKFSLNELLVVDDL